MKKNTLIGGKSDNMTLLDIAKKHKVTLEYISKQFQKGIRVEKEHTNDRNIASEIARDHLFEDPKYYIKLKKIEAHENVGSDSSGSFDSNSISKPIKRKIINSRETEIDEVTDASSSGSYDVSFSSGRKNPLAIQGKKSVDERKSYIKRKNFPLWGGPGSKFVEIKDRCKKFPYCNQGPDAITLKQSYVNEIAEDFGLTIMESKQIISMAVKEIFMDMKKEKINSIFENSLNKEVKKRILNEQAHLKHLKELSDKIVNLSTQNGRVLLQVNNMNDEEKKNLMKDIDKIMGPCDIEINGDVITISQSEELGINEINENMKKITKRDFIKFLSEGKKQNKRFFLLNGKKENINEWINKLNDESCDECDQNMKEEDDSITLDMLNTLKREKDAFSQEMNETYYGADPTELSGKNKKTLKIKEEKLIEIIYKIVNESVPGLSAVEKSHESDKGTKEYQKEVKKKMKDYLSFDGNDNPEFPHQIGKGEKVAYSNTSNEEEYIDTYRGGGPQDLKYDEEPPQEFNARIEMGLEGDATMGNKQDDDTANITKSEAGKKTRKLIKKKHDARKAEPMYKKDPQTPVNVVTPPKSPIDDSIMEEKKSTVVIEEISRMQEIIGYNKKTQ